MKKLTAFCLCCFLLMQVHAQAQRKISTCLWAGYNKTLYDYTKGNNPSGVGLGLQTFFNNHTKFTPTIEVTGDLYLEDDKVLRLNPDGSTPAASNDVRGMVNVFAGTSFQPSQTVYVSLAAGPSFISGHTFFGIKPSLGFYFSTNKKWTAKVSYINIFNRTAMPHQDFGSLSFAIGFKLF